MRHHDRLSQLGSAIPQGFPIRLTLTWASVGHSHFCGPPTWKLASLQANDVKSWTILPPCLEYVPKLLGVRLHRRISLTVLHGLIGLTSHSLIKVLNCFFSFPFLAPYNRTIIIWQQLQWSVVCQAGAACLRGDSSPEEAWHCPLHVMDTILWLFATPNSTRPMGWDWPKQTNLLTHSLTSQRSWKKTWL